MLTLKIRVPYKNGKTEDILSKVSNQLVQSESITYKIEDNTIMIRFGHHDPNLICDMRLLEIEGGE